jgi:hypothetical protein
MNVQNATSCLFVASSSGHLEVVKYLCERGGKKLLMLSAIVSALVVFKCTDIFNNHVLVYYFQKKCAIPMQMLTCKLECAGQLNMSLHGLP